MATLISDNEYYGTLNQRFDDRSKVLRRLGFVYERVEAYDIAVFVLRRPHFRKPVTVQTSFVHFADERAWSDKMVEISRSI